MILRSNYLNLYKMRNSYVVCFGDMTSQNFPQKKETSYQILLFTPGKRA